MKRTKIYLGISIFNFFGTFVMFTTLFEKEVIINQAISGMLVYGILGFLFFYLSNKTREKYNEKRVNLFSMFSKERKEQILTEKLEFEKEVKGQFENLNILIINAIANMINETKDKYNNATLFNSQLVEIDISKVLLDFSKDSYMITDVYTLNNLYTKSYYKKMVSKHLSNLEKSVRNHVVRSIPSNQRVQAINIYKEYINISLDIVSKGELIKFLSSVSTIEDTETLKQIDEVFEKVDYKYRDILIYIVDILQTCTCISKMLFVERKISELNENSEFYKIVSNMSKEINDLNLIISKTKPIYEEFYKSELGFISDELLYNIGITIMVNKIKQKKLSEKELEILDIKNDVRNFNVEMKSWLYELAKSKKIIEIEKYMLYKITLTIKQDFDLLIKYLGSVNDYLSYYYEQKSFNKKKSDKERYLAGDFSKEKKEQDEKYSLNNIDTGAQFEQYLETIFKDLNYKVKLNGKTGDQGADLILKVNDFVYVVQAKYYSSSLDNTPVQEVVGSLKYYNANQAVVVTNSIFTKGAINLAKANNVILINGKDLKKLVNYIFEDNIEEDVLQKFI